MVRCNIYGLRPPKDDYFTRGKSIFPEEKDKDTVERRHPDIKT